MKETWKKTEENNSELENAKGRTAMFLVVVLGRTSFFSVILKREGGNCMEQS